MAQSPSPSLMARLFARFAPQTSTTAAPLFSTSARASHPALSPRRNLGLEHEHARQISSHFQGRVSPEAGSPRLPGPLVVVAFTNRCGSNLFGDYLRQSQLIGGCRESLNGPTVVKMAEGYGSRSFPDHLAKLHQEFGANRLLGVKASSHQLAMLMRWKIDTMFEGGIKVIHIERDAMLDQAVSLAIAEQTQAWSSRQQARQDDVSYDGTKLDRILGGIAASNRDIRLICEAHALARHHVFYEDLVADPTAVVRASLEAVGCAPGDWQAGAPRIERQADARNVAMREALQQELKDAVAGAR